SSASYDTEIDASEVDELRKPWRDHVRNGFPIHCDEMVCVHYAIKPSFRDVPNVASSGNLMGVLSNSPRWDYSPDFTLSREYEDSHRSSLDHPGPCLSIHFKSGRIAILWEIHALMDLCEDLPSGEIIGSDKLRELLGEEVRAESSKTVNASLSVFLLMGRVGVIQAGRPRSALKMLFVVDLNRALSNSDGSSSVVVWAMRLDGWNPLHDLDSLPGSKLATYLVAFPQDSLSVIAITPDGAGLVFHGFSELDHKSTSCGRLAMLDFSVEKFASFRGMLSPNGCEDAMDDDDDDERMPTETIFELRQPGCRVESYRGGLY
ncbi:hypothetical protein DFJ73DRAFT_829101, partial [Zopfochytrium polystomum]